MDKPFTQSNELLFFLEKGSAVVFPTDTLPALATLPKNASRLWEIKKRPLNKPLILMGASEEDLFEAVLPNALEDASRMSSIYWPGSLTMVLPSFGENLQQLNLSGSSIGMRIPACDLAIDFLKKSGPLATTSANFSGQCPSVEPLEVAKCFPELPFLGPIPWPSQSGEASTVIEWKSSGVWSLLRKGAVLPIELYQ
ncbi:L-threonylcarbamoyladenylate synthase [Prochlorococcus marinus]|uniref:L-threonylcarbamoyladenylate synthase n=1 Tax=Prochlorococcus marinus TaxID=1219 RepID=UPI0022B3BA63|nr:L-threonylcarbamoyladenylate synthase [Prochlorococcus marinus]